MRTTRYPSPPIPAAIGTSQTQPGTSIRSRGQIVTKTGPTNRFRFAGPHFVESFENCRLSPIMKYEFAGTWTGPNVVD